jgi:hypothetical protein
VDDLSYFPSIYFRNYYPLDKSLQAYHLDYDLQEAETTTNEMTAEDEKMEEVRKRIVAQDPILNSRPKDDITVEHIAQRILEASREKDQKNTEDTSLDVLKLAPRDPNWDLKRNIQKKINVLERQTKRVILELVRERIQSGSGEGMQEELRLDDDEP